MESQIFYFIVLLFCTLAVSAAPASTRNHNIKHLVTLLGKIRDMERGTSTSPHAATRNSTPDVAPAGFPSQLDSSQADIVDVEESPERGYLGKLLAQVHKRQGAWSYDYGLGGGRFGKRHYGDYGIGGGRFGRDVDHVDLLDGNDADLTS
ncbi:unnamed protein product [Candidula unifasciata]|uniref:Cholecystokinin n=1 Tax=Candidula unifasciata TaxID=100452 RepID=A0A8S3YLU8_9EUPU|nr:unnamed protein product [Candidula unifasciata]